jgi:hypothetical protein
VSFTFAVPVAAHKKRKLETTVALNTKLKVVFLEKNQRGNVRYVLLVLFLVSSTAFALTGNELKDGLEKGSSYSLGYAHGVMSASNACIPKGVTNGQGVEITKKFLSENPEMLHFMASVLIEYSLLNAYPCSKREMDNKN